MKRQLGLLFFCNLLIFSVANGLLPLLPVYATELGASAAIVGGYMGFAYAVLAAGTLMSGWLAQHVGSAKGLFVLATLAGAVMVVLMGQIAALWQLVLLTAGVWFCGGIAVALIYVFTGMLTGKANRGKTFGILFLGQPAGALIGGTSIGRLVDFQGYAFLFSVLGAAWLALALAGALGLKNRPLTPVPAGGTTQPAKASMGPHFNLLLFATLLMAVATFIGRLGTSLSMRTLDFSAGAITETTAIGGLCVIPVVLLLGTLSDRVGRRGFLMLCYVVGGVGLLALSAAALLWHFWFAAMCFSMANYAGSSVASALATDLLAPDMLGKALPRLNAMNWIGGIVGFTSAGYLIDRVGYASLYVGAAFLAVVSVFILWLQSLQPLSDRTLEQSTLEIQHG